MDDGAHGFDRNRINGRPGWECPEISIPKGFLMNQLPLSSYGSPGQKIARALQLCDGLEVSGDSRNDLEALYGILQELSEMELANAEDLSEPSGAEKPPTSAP